MSGYRAAANAIEMDEAICSLARDVIEARLAVKREMDAMHEAFLRNKPRLRRKIEKSFSLWSGRLDARQNELCDACLHILNLGDIAPYPLRLGER